MKEKILTTLRRVIKAGALSFWRNRWVSSATIGIMVITLGLITSLVLSSVVAGAVLKNLEEKVDISVYFKVGVSENEITKVRAELEDLSDVKGVEYISREEALKRFEEAHKDNPAIIQSLQELEDNPLEASLNIKAKVIADYSSIASFLESTRFDSLIDTVNYRQNQKVIERLSEILDTVRKTGLVMILVLTLVAVLVTFNTIRLTIYSMREEIGVMRLVGASNWYIRGPFIVEGVIYGLVASLVAVVLLYPLVVFLSPRLSGFLPGVNLGDYFQANFWELFLLQTAIALTLGVVSSLIAMRRYLKI